MQTVLGRKSAGEFFDYFPAAEQHRRWGIYATSFGHVRVSAASSYPPSPHPKNHFFSWEKGRILQEYQLVYISKGTGQFESEFSSCMPLKEGTLCVLFPGVWHRYRPDSRTGWIESWIELQGTQIEELQRLQIIDPKRPVHEVGLMPEILAAFTAAEQLARAKIPGFQVRMGLMGLKILTHLAWQKPISGSSSRQIERVVQEALNLLASNLEQELSPEWIARELHVGYSYFRRSFKARTGFSPKQYRLEIRFRRTCDFLRNTDLTLKEIAQQLNYDSPYHLSMDFKKRTKLAPHRWRLLTNNRPTRTFPIGEIL